MKKFVILAMVVGLVASSLGAPALAKKKKKPVRVERVVEHTYTKPSPGAPGVASACFAAFDTEAGCVNIALGLGEKFINVEFADAAGQDVYWILGQDTDADQPGFEIFHEGCGNSEEAVPVTEGLELRVSVYAFGGPDCPAAATQGTIKATLSNLP